MPAIHEVLRELIEVYREEGVPDDEQPPVIRDAIAVSEAFGQPADLRAAMADIRANLDSDAPPPLHCQMLLEMLDLLTAAAPAIDAVVKGLNSLEITPADHPSASLAGDSEAQARFLAFRAGFAVAKARAQTIVDQLLISAAVGDMAVYPKVLTPALDQLLGMQNWQLHDVVMMLRAAGVNIPNKVERESAAAFHYLIPFAITYGDSWRGKVAETFDDITAYAGKRRALQEAIIAAPADELASLEAQLHALQSPVIWVKG